MTATANLPGPESSATQNSSAELAPTLLISPLRSVLAAGGCTLDALVRVRAPAQSVGSELATRQALRLSLVVDRSGSVNGAPLSEALRCVNHIASRLQPTDQMAVVLYDSQVQLPVPLQPANATTVARALAGVESGGNRALYDGWQAGVDQLLGITAGQLGLDALSQVPAATLTAQVQQGGEATVVIGPSTWHFPLLTLPVVSDADWQAAPLDETVANRLLEVAFGEQAGMARDLLQRRRLADAEKVFDSLEPQVANHPWLRNKLGSLRELARRDADMASKELRFSHMKMSKRAVALNEDGRDANVREAKYSTLPRLNCFGSGLALA